MSSRLQLKPFENLRTPLLITGRDGLVIYRNKAFASHFTKPRRGGNIYRFVGKRPAFDEVFPDSLPAYSTINIYSGTKLDIIHTSWRAFVCECEQKNLADESFDALFWLFPRRIITASQGQADALMQFYTQRMGTLKALLLECSASPNLKRLNILPFSRSPESAYQSISEETIPESYRPGGTHEIPMDLLLFFNTFCECVTKQLGLRGFRFESYCENIKIGDALTIAGLELAALCVQLIYGTLILSGSHNLIMNCFYSDKTLSIEFIAPLPDGKQAVRAEGSICDSIEQNLELATELFFCDLLWNAPGRRVKWESNPDHFTLRADCVLESPSIVRLRTEYNQDITILSDKIAEMINIIG